MYLLQTVMVQTTEFVVKFWSMQSIKIDIFNRWGKRVHHWESGDVRGFEGTWTETVWDGRGMGGRYASPGVYYYVVEGARGAMEKKGTPKVLSICSETRNKFKTIK